MKSDLDYIRIISEPVRFRILRLLVVSKQEICGCEFVDSLEMPQYSITKHIEILKEAKLVQSRKEGRWVYYSAWHSLNQICKDLCKIVAKSKDKIFKEDMKRFNKRLLIRENGKCLLGIQNSKLMNKKTKCC